MNGVQTLIVPVLMILQNRVDHQQRNQAFGGVDAQVLEEVRNDWCALCGNEQMNPEASAVVTEIIPIVLLDASATNTAAVAANVVQTSKNRESVNQAVEMNLAKRYVETVQKFGTNRSQQSSNLNSGQGGQQQQRATTPQQVHQLEP